MEVLWQCGKYYKPSVDAFMEEAGKTQNLDGIRHSDFIQRMDLAYAAADIVISRSGASTVSELCAAHKAAIFVPSPNVAEDHQTHNAMALVKKGAAVMIKDAEAEMKLMKTACDLLKNDDKIGLMERNIAALAKTDAAMTIAEEVYRITGR